MMEPAYFFDEKTQTCLTRMTAKLDAFTPMLCALRAIVERGGKGASTPVDTRNVMSDPVYVAAVDALRKGGAATRVVSPYDINPRQAEEPLVADEMHDFVDDSGEPSGRVFRSGRVFVSWNINTAILEAPLEGTERRKYLPCTLCGTIRRHALNVVGWVCDDCGNKVRGAPHSSSRP